MTLDERSQAAIREAAAILRRGGLVAFPTETVYGLGADAANEQAVARIFAAKGRPADHPVIVHIGSTDQILDWARDVPDVVWHIVEKFWPGPLTLILKRAPGVLDAVTGGQDTIGLRIPDHPVAQALLKAFGGGIAAPSANRFGRVSPTSAVHVVAEFGDSLDAILEGESCTVGLESTILDLAGNQPRVLRPGAITCDALAEILDNRIGAATDAVPRVPGSLSSHYAPDTPLRLVDATTIETAVRSLLDLQQSVAVMSSNPRVRGFEGCRWFKMPSDPRQYGQVLYASLREIDAWGCHRILVELPPVSIEWEAVRDRLMRAAGVG